MADEQTTFGKVAHHHGGKITAGTTLGGLSVGGIFWLLNWIEDTLVEAYIERTEAMVSLTEAVLIALGR